MKKNHHSFDSFVSRHIGPNANDVHTMLEKIGVDSLEQLADKVIPDSIKTQSGTCLGPPQTEVEFLKTASNLAQENQTWRSFLGQGYYGTIIPNVILRNILENPGWYTQYTPYQAEISQGRLEALLNFQTMISSLTGLPISNASLLDEATAAAEAMIMFYNMTRDPSKTRFFIDQNCFLQTIEVMKTRAEPFGIELIIDDFNSFQFTGKEFGALVQYPTDDGEIRDYRHFCESARKNHTFVVVAADIMSLVLLQPPGAFGADAAVGSTQRFGVPLGFGGPHAAYFAVSEQFKRKLPGRIIGVSQDRLGNPACRMALQTREQHIRREKATSNICTSQALLAIMAGMYSVYHGPERLKHIAGKIHYFASELAEILKQAGHHIVFDDFFDTIKVQPLGLTQESVQRKAESKNINLRYFQDGSIGISTDETFTKGDLTNILSCFSNSPKWEYKNYENFNFQDAYSGSLKRKIPLLEHPVFNAYHSETEMLRYIKKLETRDLSLTTSMIPLGSCTMKLNGTTEMLPLTWPQFSDQHPFVPTNQVSGYQKIISELGHWLKDITGFSAVSMQPNSGAQGEYTGLMMIRAYHVDRKDFHRNVCLIPASAHGTNPASAVMAGMKVVVVQCDKFGNIDVKDLKEKAKTHQADLAALMVTYPSTHGVFENDIKKICEIIHSQGGMVYMDGANLNAMVGLCKPGEFGADIVHINLHKTFAIPHGGGGPGMGPICCNENLADFLPSHPVVKTGGKKGISPVSAAPYGSAGILLISWAYIAMMGYEGLKKATLIAILNANYMAKRLENAFPVLYRGKSGFVAHEFIIDLRLYKKTTGITEEDVAKRLMDYGFHAPTMSFPVPGTLMIEPTESESKAECDRLCEALLSIKDEIIAVEKGEVDKQDNVLKNAPHTALEIAADNWDHPYSREKATYPAFWTRENKFWPLSSRIDNAYGDRNLVCQCPLVEDYS